MKKRLHLSGLGVLVLILILGLTGCCGFTTVKPLKAAKALAEKSDYAALAAMEIKCKETCEGCNQLHLLKGDACYRRAKAGDAPGKNYLCAADELAEGIRQTDAWKMEGFDLNQSQAYINLCESLRSRRDLLTGADAEGINEQLLGQARAFLAAVPGAPCGVYFEANAQLAQLRTCLLHPENCPDLCQQLEAMQQRITQSLGAGGGQCSMQLRSIKTDVTGARQAIDCR